MSVVMNSRILLLSLLTYGPNTGYGLGKLLRTELRHLREITLQQIYAELQRMLSLGLVDVEEVRVKRAGAKRLYSVTPLGENEIREWLVGVPERTLKDDLMIHLLLFERSAATPLRRFLEDRIERNQFDLATLRGGQGSDHAFFKQAMILQLECELQWHRGVLSLFDDAVRGQEPPEAGERESRPEGRLSSHRAEEQSA